MARYAAEQIYDFARKAGFDPDQAATMTAVALAESQGNSRAHNPYGEDSRGLWQINARSHPDLAARYDLYDPAQNAQAAYEVSRRGTDISPWTVTHGGSGARYLAQQEAAQAAAVAYGDGRGRGVWTGTAGYGSTTAAGGSGLQDVRGGAPHEPPDGTAPLRDGSPVDRFLTAALDQAGDRYVFGAEVDLDDRDPSRFDCSELVQWAAHQADVDVPDGAAAQYLWAKERGMLISPEQAEHTPGALLFNFSTEPRPGGGRPSTAHVAISLGNGRTIEARNSSHPVGSYEVGHRFTYAAVIPGLSDPDSLAAAQAAGPTVPPAASVDLRTAPPVEPPELGGVDSDGDGVTDLREQSMGLDPLLADTDRDSLPDGWEQVHGSDAARADSDGDLLLDNFEFAQGLDPMDPDSDDDGHLDGTTAQSWVDTDGDGVDDPLERILGLDSLLADSDQDGYVDGLEYAGGLDPADALSMPGLPHPTAGLDELTP